MDLPAIFALIIFVLLLVALAYREGRRQGEEAAQTKKQLSSGRASKKDKNKQTIMDTLAKHGELSNAELRKHLDVSPRTVVNYLDELEKEGKVVQVGDVGQGVVYRLK